MIFIPVFFIFDNIQGHVQLSLFHHINFYFLSRKLFINFKVVISVCPNEMLDLLQWTNKKVLQTHILLYHLTRAATSLSAQCIHKKSRLLVCKLGQLYLV